MELLSIFTDVADWVKGIGIIGIISGIWFFVRKNGLATIIDKFSKKGTILFRETGEMFYSLSSFSQKVDDAIKDNGKLVENNVNEAIAAGKKVVAETKDVVMIIKPKKKKKFLTD